MTKSIIIKEFATDKTLNSVKKVVTKRRTASDIEWLPEDECNLIQKTFTKRGTYRASDYNAYGFSKVTVNMSKSKNAEPQKNGEHKIIKPSVTIMEGDVGKTLGGISRLRIKNTDGNFSRWIPEANVELADRSIRGNGVFIANKDGVYGYSKVVITTNNNKRTVTKPDGNEYSQDIDDDGNQIIDDDTGEPIEEKLPSSINITTNPTKTNYEDGEAINIAGIVVKAYYGDGTEWGTVPKDELYINPKKADANETYVIDSDVVVGTQTIHSPLSFKQLNIGDVYEMTTTSEVYGSIVVPLRLKRWKYDTDTVYIMQYNHAKHGKCATVFSKSPFTGYGWAEIDGEEVASSAFWSLSMTIQDKKVYYNNHFDMPAQIPTVEMSASQDRDTELGVVAWAALYGGDAEINQQTITVNWKRPEDDKVLKDTFDIAVTPDSNAESNGDGNDGGGGGGSW